MLVEKSYGTPEYKSGACFIALTAYGPHYINYYYICSP